MLGRDWNSRNSLFRVAVLQMPQYTDFLQEQEYEAVPQQADLPPQHHLTPHSTVIHRVELFPCPHRQCDMMKLTAKPVVMGLQPGTIDLCDVS